MQTSKLDEAIIRVADYIVNERDSAILHTVVCEVLELFAEDVRELSKPSKDAATDQQTTLCRQFRTLKRRKKHADH